MKKQYEEEIARLCHQLNRSTKQDQAPNIGPVGSNYISSIMSAGLVAPAQLCLADQDPTCLPGNLKIEGLDWFTL